MNQYIGTSYLKYKRKVIIIFLIFSGDKFSVCLLDMFGFECYHRNRIEQLIVNTTNEQIQFLYNQRIFAWEMQETAEEEDIPVVQLHFYDNKNSVDQLMGRPLGLFYILDEASRTGSGQEFIMSMYQRIGKKNNHYYIHTTHALSPRSSRDISDPPRHPHCTKMT
jgi:myosin heavy subunit